MRPRVVTAISPAVSNTQQAGLSIDSNHPNILAILALSDLSKLFELVGLGKTTSDKTESRQNHITLKLSFYVAQILFTPSAILRHVVDEILARSKVIEQEAVPLLSNTAGHHLPSTDSDLRKDGVSIKIEVLT